MVDLTRRAAITGGFAASLMGVCQTSSATTLALRGDVGGLGVGWSCGAYSNPETFSKAAAEQFASACSRVGMSVGFLYPGNAKNEMILQKDSDSLEKVHLIAMYGHGSPWGPDLEYVPSANIMSWSSYKWGDAGVSRWIFIGGCDAIGFPVFTDDGSPAPNAYPSLHRFGSAMQGVSGICGYRSSSWYIPGFQALSPINEWGTIDMTRVGGGYGAELANRMGALQSFYDAWTGSAHWLHNQLGRGAEVAAICNTTDNNGEHLQNYRADRRNGVDVGSVRRTAVGSGTAPEYHYCEVVDRQGMCAKSAIVSKYHSVSDYDKAPVLSTTKLPIYRWGLSAQDISTINNVGITFGVERILDLYTSSSAIEAQSTKMFATAHAGEISLASRTGRPVDTAALLRALEATPRNGLSLSKMSLGRDAPSAARYTRSVANTGQTIPIRLDTGIEVNGNARHVQFQGAVWSIVSESGTRTLPSAADAFRLIAAWCEARGSKAKANIEVVYAKIGGSTSGLLMPCLQANVVEDFGHRVDTWCVFI